MTEKAELLAQYVKSLKGFRFECENRELYGNIGATIIDGILQAGMRYRTVVGRVNRYLSKHSDVKTTSGFKKLIESKGASEVVHWNGQKTETIRRLTEFLVTEGVETEADFYHWLDSDENIKRLKSPSGIKGIKDKTADYLKILTGHDTIAIDTRLLAFLKGAGIDESRYHEAKQIISDAADLLGVKKRILDHSIWLYMSEERK